MERWKLSRSTYQKLANGHETQNAPGGNEAIRGDQENEDMKRGNLLWPTPTDLRRVGYDSYKAYQQSEHWQAIRVLYRATVLPQDCPCGKPGSQLHHQHYQLLGREWEDLSCLKSLCGGCHQFLHGLAREPEDYCLTPRGRPHGRDKHRHVREAEKDPRRGTLPRP